MATIQRPLVREGMAMSVIIGGLMIGASNWFLLPAAREHAASVQQSRAIEYSLRHALDLDAVRNRLSEIQDRFESIQRINAQAGDSAQLFDLLNGYGRETGVEMGKISPGAEQVIETGVTSESLHLTVSGSYQQVIAYLDRLDTCELFHRVAGLRLVPQESSPDAEVTAYIQIELIRFDTEAIMATLEQQEKGG